MMQNDRPVPAGHLPDTGDGKPGCHGAQHKAILPCSKYWLQRLQKLFHHLGLYRQKNQLAVRCDLAVVCRAAAQLCGQGLCLGCGAVGQIDAAGGSSPADGPGDGAAHIAAAQKTDLFKHRLGSSLIA